MPFQALIFLGPPTEVCPGNVHNVHYVHWKFGRGSSRAVQGQSVCGRAGGRGSVSHPSRGRSTHVAERRNDVSRMGRVSVFA